MTQIIRGAVLVGALLTMLAPIATAQNETAEQDLKDPSLVEDCDVDDPCASYRGGNESERPDDAAWVEDCPPDMMCAMQYGNESCIECSGPVDGCEEGAICSHAPAPDGNWTEGWGEPCPPDAFCLYDGAPSDDEVDEDAPPATDDEEDETARDSPVLGLLFVFGILGAAAIAMTFSRER